jgi:hypothetical protein
MFQRINDIAANVHLQETHILREQNSYIKLQEALIKRRLRNRPEALNRSKIGTRTHAS